MKSAASTETEPFSAWGELCDLLCGTSEVAGVEQVYPDATERLSVAEALRSTEIAMDSQRHKAGVALAVRLHHVVQQARTFSRIAKCPVVGITGMLNAGKSSLLSTYLSESGRRRVLRGVGNEQGTHRFVLWLPSVWWSQPDLLGTLTSYLTSIFGCPPESLADDPETAFAQYNGQIINVPAAENSLTQADGRFAEANSALGELTDPLRVPLLARDDALNDLGLGLLDCPDIQTGFTNLRTADGSLNKAAMDHSRREHLARVGRICSAFIVVTKFSSLHDEGLNQVLVALREAMPVVPRLLAVNRIKARYSPEVVAQQSQLLMDRFEISRLFLAYDYRSHIANTRVPPPPPKMHAGTDEPLPIFFEHCPASEKVAGTNSVCYLLDLADRLDAGTLARESRRSLSLQLEELAQESIQWLNRCQSYREDLVQSAWQAIADACFEFMAQRDSAGEAVGLRLQTSPTIVAQMSDSLIRNAPWSIRLSLKIDRSVRQLQHSIASSTSRFRILQSVSGGVSHLMQRFRHGESGQVVTATRLASEILRLDGRNSFQNLSESEFRLSCEQALARFQHEDKTRLGDESLDRWSRALWLEMPLKKKIYVGAMPLAPIFAPLLAVTFIPFDGGGSAVLVFASIKELLAAAGIAALATTTLGGQETTDIIEREAAWTQLSELFSFTCDSLGVVRPSPERMPSVEFEGSKRPLSPSAVAIKPPPGRAAVSMWKIADHFEPKVRSLIHTLQSDVREP